MVNRLAATARVQECAGVERTDQSRIRGSTRRGWRGVGELIRTKDWSRSSLGPLETWPISLKALLRATLNSQQPMAVYWGPDLLHLYNDAYLPIVGKKHPGSFGQRVQDTWQNRSVRVGLNR